MMNQQTIIYLKMLRIIKNKKRRIKILPKKTKNKKIMKKKKVVEI